MFPHGKPGHSGDIHPPPTLHTLRYSSLTVDSAKSSLMKKQATQFIIMVLYSLRMLATLSPLWLLRMLKLVKPAPVAVRPALLKSRQASHRWSPAGGAVWYHRPAEDVCVTHQEIRIHQPSTLLRNGVSALGRLWQGTGSRTTSLIWSQQIARSHLGQDALPDNLHYTVKYYIICFFSCWLFACSASKPDLVNPA